MQFQVPPNTTILGVGSEAKLVEGYLSLNTMSQTFGQTENSNIIIRNVTFEAPRDFAPAWDGSDGASGNWNARYDAISINASNHIWIDHCSFSDGEHFDKDEPVIFGKHIQRHDGLLDIEDDSDYITLSYNVFSNHDKTMIIGSGDSDAGDYRITFEGTYGKTAPSALPGYALAKCICSITIIRGLPMPIIPSLMRLAWGISHLFFQKVMCLIFRAVVQQKI
ncbi:hypothetical protein P4S72_02485 [Vibrio sp. PP-XX7]